MAKPGALPAICEDERFVKLAQSTTSPEEFASTIKEHLLGYTQRKMLLDGMKEVNARLEAIEQKLVVAKAIGKKAGELDETQQYLHQNFVLANMKEKVTLLNTSINETLDEGVLTVEELEPTLDSLKSRLIKAKADGKEKLIEKLTRQVGVLTSAKPVPVPVKEVKEIFELTQQLDEVQQLAMKNRRDLTADEREKVKVSHKVQLELALDNAKERSQMWFETAEDFKSRLDKALAWYSDHLEELEKEARAAEKERKRLEALAKEEQKWKEVEQKIEQKRLAALEAEKDLTPSQRKHAQQSKQKVKKTTGVKVDAGHFFREPSKQDEAEDVWNGPEDIPAPAAASSAPAQPKVDAAEMYAAEEAAAAAEEERLAAEAVERRRAEQEEKRRQQARETPGGSDAEPSPQKEAEAAAEERTAPEEERVAPEGPDAKPAPKPKPRPRPVEKESMWRAPTAAFRPQERLGGEDEEAPSLADSLKAPKKRPQPVVQTKQSQPEVSQPSQSSGAPVDAEDIYAAEEAAEREAEEAEAAERLAALRASRAQKTHADASEQTSPKTPAQAAAPAPAESPAEKEEPPSPPAREEPAPAPKPKPRPKPVEKESLWGTSETQEEDPLPSLGPSLADALKAAPGKKGPASQPAAKKKGTKKFAKVALGDLGFAYSDAGGQQARPDGPSQWAAPDATAGGE